MTYDFEAVCMPAERFVFAGGGSLRRGAANTLVVAWVRRGGCTLITDAGGATAANGGFLAARGPALFSPLPQGRGCGVALAGAAALRLAESLPAPVVLEAGHCAGAELTLLQLAESGEKLSAAEASAAGYGLICRIAAAAEAAGAAQTLPELVLAAVGAIREHYAQVYGIEELAESLQVSKSHLIRRFTAAVGISPGRYLTAVRVEAAKRLLLRGGLSLEAIAGLCGFSGANYLCRVFSAHTGESPAAWRRRAGVPESAAPPPTGEQRVYL